MWSKADVGRPRVDLMSGMAGSAKVCLANAEIRCLRLTPTNLNSVPTMFGINMGYGHNSIKKRLMVL